MEQWQPDAIEGWLVCDHWGKQYFHLSSAVKCPLLWFGLGSILGPTICVPRDLGQATSLWAAVSLRELEELSGFHTALKGVLSSPRPFFQNSSVFLHFRHSGSL